MSSDNGLPGWPAIIAMIVVGAGGLTVNVVIMVRHAKRTWKK